LNFVDIAGLVRGASKGEGLGNQFLANIRETDAIAHVVRCFEDDNIVHVENRIDPLADVGTIDTELCLKDLESIDKRIDRAKKALKGPASKDEKLTLEVCERVKKALDEGRPVRAQGLTAEEQAAAARHRPADPERSLLRGQRRRKTAGQRRHRSLRQDAQGARHRRGEVAAPSMICSLLPK